MGDDCLLVVAISLSTSLPWQVYARSSPWRGVSAGSSQVLKFRVKFGSPREPAPHGVDRAVQRNAKPRRNLGDLQAAAGPQIRMARRGLRGGPRGQAAHWQSQERKVVVLREENTSHDEQEIAQPVRTQYPPELPSSVLP